MAQHHYFHYFQGKGDIRDAQHHSQYYFYCYLKKLFQDSIDYKWKVKKYQKFVTDNNLSFSYCYEVLSHFGDTDYFKNTECRKKGVKEFIQILKKHYKISGKRKYHIKGNPADFIKKMVKVIMDETDMPAIKALQIIHANYHTGYTFSTFRSYWYERWQE